MNQLITDILPYLMSSLMAAIGWQFRESYLLKTKVAVMEKTIDSIKETMKGTTDNILKTIDSIQKRQDAHSQKQDDVLEKINSMEHELLKHIGDMGANISSLASDVKNLNNLLAITDVGIKLQK